MAERDFDAEFQAMVAGMSDTPDRDTLLQMGAALSLQGMQMAVVKTTALGNLYRSLTALTLITIPAGISALVWLMVR